MDSLRGADLPHDLYVGLDLRLPAGSEAGPYFRAVGVAPGGVIEGRGLPGYSVRLGHSGAVSVHSLNHPDNADPDPVARSVPRAGFDANEWHRLEGEIRGSTLRVWRDGEPVLFGMDNARAREVPVAAAKAGSAAGIATVAPEQPVSSIEFRNVTVRKARPQL